MPSTALYQKILAWFNFSQFNLPQFDFLPNKAQSKERSAKRTQLKQNLLGLIEQWQTPQQWTNGAPLTSLDLDQQQLGELKGAIAALEAVTPYPAPLRQGIELLDGSWLLRYSDAGEITSIATRTKFGLRLAGIYQTIDVAGRSFENRAYVQNRWVGLVGAVAVTARFEPATTPRSVVNRRINVFFEQTSLSITQVLGLKTPLLNPLKVIPITPPEDKMPCLDLVYLDETLRLGRGGEGSIFVLTKV